MKFDPFLYDEFAIGVEKRGVGLLVVATSGPAALYVTSAGYEVLVGYGSSWDIAVSGEFTFRVDGPKGTRAFFEVPQEVNYESAGEVFTNADRLPFESGAMLEVRRAIRVQRLEHLDMMSKMRDETAALVEARKAAVSEPDVKSAAPDKEVEDVKS